MSEEEYALEQAASTGQPYELVSARTESSDTWALPDGSWSVKRYGTPVRMLRDGAWIPTDATLEFTADGRVSPKASTVSVSFSGGGTDALLTGVKDGRTLSLTWPKPLPTPTLSENVATYAEVLPGVDLQLKAEVEGFSQLLVVKTAEAARNPELVSLAYKVDTVGVTVSKDAETGSITATNPAGQTVFTSPSPLMWDSTTVTSAGDTPTTAALSADEGETPADAFVPPPGAQDAQMDTSVSGDTLAIEPDQDLLTGADTQYPVYIDPSWTFGERQNWTRVYKAYPNNSYWNTKEDVRVGYEAETGGSNRISRSFFQMDTSDVKGAMIKSATFRIRNTWSWSCQDRPVELWSVGAISSKTTWNNQPAKYARQDTVNDSKGWSTDCAAGNLEFDATSKVADAAAKGASSVTLGLYASDETDTFGWKRFDAKKAVLDISYNFRPETPEKLGTTPKTSCTSGGLIGNTRISLNATINDKDKANLTARFQVFKSGSGTAVVDQSIPAVRGGVATLSVPDSDLSTGDYTWQVLAKDKDGVASAWSKTCKFSVDRTRPSHPPIITSVNDQFPPGDAGWPAVTGEARTEGEFLFDPNGVTDVDHYEWFTDYDPSLQDTYPAHVTPPGYGPHFVYAYSVDKAGNRSDTATYLYYATRSPERDEPGDLNGDKNLDIWSIDSNGTLLTYAGQDNRDFAAATNGGGHSFAGASVASSGDWGQDGYNDLVTLEYNDIDKRKNLWVYDNNGRGTIDDAPHKLTVSCPVEDPDGGCPYADDHWRDAEQVISAGYLNGDSSPDLLVKQGKQLWAYYGNRNRKLADSERRPVLVGNGDWDQFTVIVPGDLNNDTIPDLWLRHDTTGDLYRAYGAKGPDDQLDPTTWGAPDKRVKIGTGFKAATYPAIGSIGDLDGNGYVDLWTRKADNTMHGWPGKAPGTDGTAFGTSYLIDGITGGSRIPAGTTLSAGQSYTSNSAKLTMRDDGNLIITSNSGNVLWSTNTTGNIGAKAVMGTDGNLAVYAADDTTRLWESNTSGPEGYALLQDSGDLVVYNAKSQSQWSSGSSIRHDYNADGRSDMATWYDYADGSDRIHTFTASSQGLITAPLNGYTATAGTWDASLMKRTTGDYNGDGIGDVAALAKKTAADDTSLYVWTGKGDGTFNAPVSKWTGTWAISRSNVQSGDFSGDGRDDIAVWYDYADGSDKLFTFVSRANGTFVSPTASYTRDSGLWNVSNSKFTTGDFNGDGRDDLGAFYGYDDGTSKIWTLTANPDGGFAAPVSRWDGPTWGSLERTSLYSGDFNGDGFDDIAAWYDYVDGHDGITAWSTGRTGALTAGKSIWSVAAGSFIRDHMKIITGDFNGDGRDDFGALYGYDDGRVGSFTWLAQTDGTLDAPAAGWSVPAGQWDFDRTTMIERYSPA